jgi:hypothetical protein
MKPLKADQPMRSVSLAYSVTLQALKSKSLHEEEGAWMQAPIEVSRRGVGEVFSLDILSHRTSEMAILRQTIGTPAPRDSISPVKTGRLQFL